MRPLLSSLSLVTVFVSTSVTTLMAEPILLTPGSGLYQVDHYEPIGQSFTAEDRLVRAGLYFEVINQGAAGASDPIQYDLYNGAGPTGTLLASRTFSLSPAFTGFRVVDFGDVPLITGSLYTLTASVIGSSFYWGIRTTDVAYGGGTGFVTEGGIVSPTPFDFAVSVAPVPEPSSLSLIALGVAGLAARHRRQRRTR